MNSPTLSRRVRITYTARMLNRRHTLSQECAEMRLKHITGLTFPPFTLTHEATNM